MSRANGDRSGGCHYRHGEPNGANESCALPPCHFVVPKARSALTELAKAVQPRNLCPQGNGRNVVKSVLPRTPSLTLEDDVGVNAACAARFLGYG
jgi:hypothetical protein